jgi:beta-alanine--pyruvate transaminase
VGTNRAWWMPFTANNAFHKAPRLLSGAKGMIYRSADGREVLDGVSGLWCVNAGHGRAEIAEAIARQAAEMDFAPSFQMGHPLAFEYAERLADFAPGDLDHVFFTNSGSEAVDTALKIARAYHRANGEPERVLFVGRERGYHGAGFGGTSVGGMEPNRVPFAPLLADVDWLPLPAADTRFVCGQAPGGAAIAQGDLEAMIDRHGEARIAAVVLEAVAGSGGVRVPPQGYLERVEEICREHGILLILDEVITGFGRLGARFASERFSITPDLISVAKGMTNGSVPMGACLARRGVHDTIIDAAGSGIELPHGYTYSGHPLACAAALATLDLHEGERLWERAASLEPLFETSIHALGELPAVTDVRNLGFMGAIDVEPEPASPGQRGMAIFQRCFDRGVLLRVTGDTLAVAPPLIASESDLGRIYETLEEAVRHVTETA